MKGTVRTLNISQTTRVKSATENDDVIIFGNLLQGFERLTTDNGYCVSKTICCHPLSYVSKPLRSIKVSKPGLTLQRESSSVL